MLIYPLFIYPDSGELHLSTDLPVDAVDLLTLMLNVEQGKRPIVSNIIAHMFFYSDTHKVNCFNLLEQH
jgi:hypothetical protein